MSISKCLLTVLLWLGICLLPMSMSGAVLAAESNATMAVSATEVKAGDTVTVTLSNKQINVQGFGVYLEFDKAKLECTAIIGTDGDEYLGLHKTSGKTTWVDANVGDTVAETNSDGIFSFGVIPGLDTEYKAADFATLTFKAKAAGTVKFVLNEDTAGADKFKGVAASQIITVVGKTEDAAVSTTGESEDTKETGYQKENSTDVTSASEEGQKADKTVNTTTDVTLSVSSQNTTNAVSASSAKTGVWIGVSVIIAAIVVTAVLLRLRKKR